MTNPIKTPVRQGDRWHIYDADEAHICCCNREEQAAAIVHALNRVVELEAACRAALYDLETSENLWACDNEQGQSLFQLQHPSIQQLQTAIGGKEPPQ